MQCRCLPPRLAASISLSPTIAARLPAAAPLSYPHLLPAAACHIYLFLFGVHYASTLAVSGRVLRHILNATPRAERCAAAWLPLLCLSALPLSSHHPPPLCLPKPEDREDLVKEGRRGRAGRV